MAALQLCKVHTAQIAHAFQGHGRTDAIGMEAFCNGGQQMRDGNGSLSRKIWLRGTGKWLVQVGRLGQSAIVT